MNRWFRHYAGMMRDPKFVGIAARTREPLERVLFVWGCILENASEQNDGGRYALDTDELAYTLRCDVESIEKIHSSFGVDMVSDGVVLNWKARQFETDTHDGTGAERQRRHREKKRNGAVTDVTPLRNGTVTAQSTESETEKTKAPSGALSAPAVAPLPVVDTKRVIFGDCLRWMMAADQTKTEAQHRDLLGKMVKKYGDVAVILAIQTASRDPPAGNPMAWVIGLLKQGAQHGRNTSSTVQRDRDVTGHATRFASWSDAAREPADGAAGEPLDHDRAA